MSTKTFLVLLALLLLRSQLFGQKSVIRAHCIGVHDGDTITVLVQDNQHLRIRLDAGNGQLTKSHPVQLQPHPFDASNQLSAQGYTPGPHRVESARSAALAPLPSRAMPSPQPPKMVATMLAEELPEEGPEEESPQEAAARSSMTKQSSSLCRSHGQVDIRVAY